ncbi:unnamed protein product [Danaus chrysippus]|uniref:(African queen) hypothetical protein n=1 Tax=Danaus chrysippus TaxID=151541 RepID=A0A8J2QPS2_9NEOP|nr:unnamed protein product [Danaus chrysippus]
MGKHKEWRRIVKRERRRRIRKQLAKERDSVPDGNDSQDWIKAQEELEAYILEQVEISNKAENEKWLAAEAVALKQWQELQIKKEILLKKQLELQAKLQQEWEMEKERKEKEAQRLKELEEENVKRQEEFMKNLEEFLNGDCKDPPQELLTLYESRPNCDPCPFYAKTACCRFGDECSRNHKYPGISKILLAPNLFGHFGLENSNFNEYDTDIMLEYEDSDTYKDFKEFFFDILPEFQKFGQVVGIKVCKNVEKHLRGNTYIEYSDIRSAVSAYRALHTRWYGGKQLSLQFCRLLSWSSAICGLQVTGRCPKGRACNFLHVFKNPVDLHADYKKRYSKRQQHTSSRSWRWSESPERESPTPRSKRKDDGHSKSRERRHYQYRSPRARSHRYRD